MTDTFSVEAAYKVVRAAGDDNVVVKVQPGTDCAKRAGDPTAVFHDGTIARAHIDNLNGSGEEDIAELRAALLVIAAEDGSDRPALDLSDKDVAYLRLVCDGLSDAECAEKLGLSLRAIKSRKKSVLAATSCLTLSHAVKRFVREYASV